LQHGPAARGKSCSAGSASGCAFCLLEMPGHAEAGRRLSGAERKHLGAFCRSRCRLPKLNKAGLGEKCEEARGQNDSYSRKAVALFGHPRQRAAAAIRDAHLLTKGSPRHTSEVD
jgi:hypothetical protein